MVVSVRRQAASDFSLASGTVSRKVLHWRLAVAPAPLMWSLFVVPGDPGIEVGLQLLDTTVDAFAERHLIEFLQDGFVEALTDAVGLRASRLGAAVVDVLHGQVELVFVRLGGAAEFRAAVGQHASVLDVV